MKRKQMLELIQEMETLIKFHELEAVDSKAAELLIRAKGIRNERLTSEETDSWFESLRQANLVETAR